MNIKSSICAVLFLNISILSFSQVETNPSRFDLELLGGGSLSTYFGDDIDNNAPLVRFTGGLRVSYDVFHFLSFETGAGYGKFGTVEKNADRKIRNVVSYFQFPLIIRYQWGSYYLGAGMEFNLLNTAKVIIKEEGQIFEGVYYKASKFDTREKHYTFKSSYCIDFGYKLNDIHSFGLTGSYYPETILNNGYDWKPGYLKIYYKLNLLGL